MLQNLFIVILFIGHLAYGQEPYAVDNISPNLLENANAVVRLNSMDFEIISPNQTKSRIHKVITILNKQAVEQGYFNIYYDTKRSRITDLEGFVYDLNGERLEKLKKSDVYDLPLLDNTFDSDQRQKIIRLEADDYPYTIELSYEIEREYLLWGPTWYPLTGEHVSLEEGRCQILVNTGVGLRYKAFNMPEPESGIEGIYQKYVWNISELAPIKEIPFAESLRSYFPVLLTAPNRFNYDDYPGDMSTWDTYAKWVSGLLEEVGPLPQSESKKVQQLVSGITDPYDIVRTIYEYVQGNTRYISIQLGIGGFKPLDPSFVIEKGYGDCKALTFYTKSLLEAVEIPSYYTLVNAGANEDDILTDFPSSQFNHVFLCVPLNSDTVWLECTSQDKPTGYNGSFTGGRHVLLIDGNKGKFVKTPTYEKSQNAQSTRTKVTLEENGSASVRSIITHHGLAYESVRQALNMNHADQKKWLYNKIEIPSFTITNFQISEKRDPIPTVTIHSEIDIKRLAKISGKRIFLPVNLIDEKEKKFSPDEEREVPFTLKHGYLETDTIEYLIPEHLHPEFIPEKTEMNTSFGSFLQKIEVSENSILIIRKLEYNHGTYQPDAYSELLDLHKEVNNSDKAKIVLVTKT